MSITFLSTSQLLSLLQKDNDHYYDTFTKYDLRARGVTSIEEYKKKLICCKTITKKIIEKITKKIDEIFSTFSKPWFNGKRAAKIPWKIAFLPDTYSYEVHQDLHNESHL